MCSEFFESVVELIPRSFPLSFRLWLSSAKMPAAIPWGDDELQALVSNPQSRVFVDQRRISVALQPFHLLDLKSAVRDLLNASVGGYDKSLDGILLSFNHLKVLSKSASVTAETSAVILDIQADFYVFRPEIGCILKGVVNKISKDHVGVLLYHRFNITCPRPSSVAKSKKWIGSNVVMCQEVIFKLKEKSFSGTVPFFSAKIMDIGTVITETLKGVDKKSMKKKAKDMILEKSNVSETSSTISKKHKLKPEELEQTMEEKTKKSKKDDTSKEIVKRLIEDAAGHVSSESSISKKKKKKTSVVPTDEMGFIPRFSLDASPLPEHLPPPNADSTHFDFTKNLSEKKKVTNAGLDLIREESSDILKGVSKVNTKREMVSEIKTKKKLQAERLCNEFNNKTEASSFNSEFANDNRSKTLPESVQKKKQTIIESVGTNEDTNIKAKKMPVVSSYASLLSSHPVSPKKKGKVQESSSEVEETVPRKRKKASVSFQLDLDEQRSEDDNEASKLRSPSDNKADLHSPIKSKKKSKDQINTSPSKIPKVKKDKSVTGGSAKTDVASDDIIPPGQRSIWESPKKQQLVNSPLREQSISSVSITKSPGIGYFAASSSMMDFDFNSSRKGPRQAPLMFGTLEGKIFPPPESPMKSPPSKKAIVYGSDSDTPSPKKVIISSSVRPESSDSSDSESSLGKPSLKKKGNLALKQKKDNSDESDSDASVKRLIQSMGVMQSPLKTTKLNLRHDTSDSESEGSSDVEGRNMVSNQHKPPTAVKFSNVNKSDQKPLKPILAAKIKMKPQLMERAPSPKKSAKTNIDDKSASKAAKLSPFKGNDGSRTLVVPEESDSDSDLEIMKAAMLKMEQERLGASKPIPKSKAKPSKSNSDSDNVLSKKALAISEKKPNDKASYNTLKSTSKYSKDISSKDTSSDDDASDSELMKTAISKIKEEQGFGRTSKPSDESNSKRGKSKANAKNILTSTIDHKRKTSDKISDNSSKVTSTDSKTLGSTSNDAYSSDAGISTSQLIKSVLSRFNEQLSGGTSKPKSKSKSKEKKSEGKSKMETADVLLKKNLSSVSDDTDSGPDDKNTTVAMEEMRHKRLGGDLTRKKKMTGKKLKGEETELFEKSSHSKDRSVEKGFESINGSKSKKKKDGAKDSKTLKALESIEPRKMVPENVRKVEVNKIKSSKVNVTGKITAGQNSVVNKKAPKRKKKGSTDDEISDVLQRLLKQAQLSVGLA